MYKLYDSSLLQSTDGASVEVIKAGLHNPNSGPDFLNAQVRVGDTLWVGNVEIHRSSSDWLKHKHENDPAYNNVILHVVYQDDMELNAHLNHQMPTLILKERISAHLFSNYESFKRAKSWIPCESQIAEVDEFKVKNWVDRVLIRRLEQRSNKVIEILEGSANGDWQLAFFIILAKSFGFKVNALAFEYLMKTIPLAAVFKHKNDLFQLESILFGQSGLLDRTEHSDEYIDELKKEYSFLKKKYLLTPMSAVHWRHSRLRPANFPTIRIAQFARLFHREENIYSKLFNIKQYKDLFDILTVTASSYWDTHYTFDRTSKPRKKTMGKASVESIAINTIVPFLFAYGEKRKDENAKQQALELLEQIPPENNTVIQKWESLGLPVDNAMNTQGLLELKREYCDQKKCLSCQIGYEILGKSFDNVEKSGLS